MRTLLISPDSVSAALKLSEPVAQLQTLSQVQVLCGQPVKALFECMTGVQQVHFFSGENRIGYLRSQLQVARQLRKEQFDQVIVMRAERRWTALSLAMGSRASTLAMALQGNPLLLKSALLNPILKAPNIDSRYIRRKFGVSALMPMVVFHQQQFNWPTRYWVEFIQLMNEAQPFQVVFVGNAGQRAQATEICAISNLTTPTHNLCGLTSLRDLLGLLACAKVCVGNDMVTTELGLALGTKTVDMVRTPLSTGASPRDLMSAVENVLSNGNPSHAH